MNKCNNWRICHNEAKRGHDLCQSCIDAATRLDNEPVYLPYVPKYDGHTRDERIKTNNERQRSSR